MTRVQWLSVSLGVVIAAVLPWTFGMLIVGVLLVIAGWGIRCRQRRCLGAWVRPEPKNGRSLCAAVSRCLAPLGIGLVVANAQFLSYEETLVKEVEKRYINGCIVSRVVLKDGTARFEFEEDKRSRLGRAVRYRLTWRSADAVVAGSCWQLYVRLKPLRGTRNEVGFDYERWLFAQRLSALGSVDAERSFQVSRICTCARYLQFRETAYRQLSALMQDKLSGAVVVALGVGIREGFEPGDWETLTRSGTAHLMAISGLHIGLAAVLGFSLGRFLPIALSGRTNLNRRGAICALTVALFYAALAGFAVSTLRALFMLFLWHIWRSMGRSVSVVTTLLMTVAVLLILYPWMVADSGFWLSVGAVAAIALAVFGRPAATDWRGKLRLAIRIQLGITLIMLPVSLPVAQGVSWVAIPVNLILIPLFSLVVVPSVLLLLCILLIAPQHASFPATLLAALLDPIWSSLTLLAHQSWSFSEVSTLSFWATVPAGLCGLMLLLPKGFPSRRIAALLSLPLFCIRADTVEDGFFRIDVLDVGQALSIVIQTRAHYTVYDTGNAWPGGDSAQQSIVPLLEKRQATSLHSLIISHADRDHAGGAVSLVERFSTDFIWVGEPVKDVDNAQVCAAGTSWRMDGVEFKFLHPPVNRAYQGNQQSCVLLIQGQHHTVLITGDLGGPLERQLIHHLTDVSVDLVIGAHHGSLSSSDERFVNHIAARYVVFSNGYSNQWGMPRDTVVARWEAAGTQVFTTALQGQLQFGPNAQSEFELVYHARQAVLGRWRWHPPALE